VSEAVPRALPGDTKRLRAWKVISDELTAIWAACGPFEYVALGYLAFSSALIAIFAENLAHPFRLLVTQALVASVILFLCRRTDISLAPASHSRRFARKFWHFWRHWYPHLFFLFCFEELAYLVHLVSPNWQDARLIAFDYWLTGVNPVLSLEQLATPAHNQFLPLSYTFSLPYFL